MQKQIALDPFQNVVAAGVAICDLNKLLGTVVEKMTFTLGGTFTKAMITKIEIKANGKVIFETDGSKLDASNLYNGGAADATILKLDFMDRKAVTVNARQAGALDLSPASKITALRLEVTIAGATAPTLTGLADVSAPTDDASEQAIRFLTVRRHRATVVIGAAGQFALPIPHLDPAGGGSNYRRIHIYSANLTALKTVREGVTEHELTKLQNEASQKDNSKTPQANLVVFDPVQDGQLQGRTWDTRPGSGVRSAQFYATFSAGETITVETEELLPVAAY
ncbi:MAG TPA: major capsid protein P2 [Ramlibacter sp.]|uniref:major capsid protein P2 n=1 Tax=Ramlibacter sp. TaxID=1917967 RepID=UPI002ED2AA9B